MHLTWTGHCSGDRPRIKAGQAHGHGQVFSYAVHITERIAACVLFPTLEMFVLKNAEGMDLMPGYWFQAVFRNQICPVTQAPRRETEYATSQVPPGSNESVKILGNWSLS